ncbi:hypothetical protein AJ87_15825 [Rhizobium yanglingense]|nr:hypothetical protein AJ87_15825 [Rhizobium yanglingense]
MPPKSRSARGLVFAANQEPALNRVFTTDAATRLSSMSISTLRATILEVFDQFLLLVSTEIAGSATASASFTRSLM